MTSEKAWLEMMAMVFIFVLIYYTDSTLPEDYSEIAQFFIGLTSHYQDDPRFS
ncbi:MAG: hypothetical protein ACOYNF_01280 [Rhodoferax sp.]